ncbi:MAG: C40 family peptidase [Phocaeicola sp.]
MKKSTQNLILLTLFSLLVSSCKTTASHYNYQEIAKSSIKLGVDINKKDNHRLYVESARWIGVPHRMGGTTKQGIDCSGLTKNIYKEVYKMQLERNSNDQRVKNCRKVKKTKLREGDLVFFHNGRNKKQANHVGIYLKNRLFIHTSSSQGVIISNLDEDYYHKHWLAGGRKK